MPRPLRVQVEGAASYIYQDALEGIELFKNEEDYAAYIRLLKEYQDKYQFNLFSYALTPSKIHLLLEPTGDVSTSQIMRDITSRYSKYYNGCYDHTGSLFHGRFKTVLVEMGPALEEVKLYLTTLASSAAAWSVESAVVKDATSVVVSEGLAEALRGTAYGSAEFMEFVKQSSKPGHAVEAVSKAAPIQSSVFAQASAVATATKVVPVFSLGFAAAAGVLVVSSVIGTYLWTTRPAVYEKHAAKVESVKASPKTQTEAVVQPVLTEAKAAQRKLVIVLDGTEWNVQLIPTEGEDARNRKVEFDQLKFMSSRMASQKFTMTGFDAAHYTVSQTPEGVIVWETMQRNSNGEMVSWRGEWIGNEMKGVLSKQLLDGKSQVFNFVGTMRDANTGAAAGSAPKMI